MINLNNNNKTEYFFDKWNMMLSKLEAYNLFGRGDALWRTSLALICSGMKELVFSVLSCTKTVNGKIRFVRHPNDFSDTCSRDQAIPAMISLKLYSYENYLHVKNNLSYRISNKFMWLDSWFWAKERYFIWRIISSYHFIGWFLEPSYSIHLFCWMIWSSKQKMPLYKWFLLKFIVHNRNFLLRALLNDEFTEFENEMIKNYKPRIDLIWQRNFPIDIIEHRRMTEEESEYNELDKLLLDFVIKRK